jgi:hypothetical protein
VAAGLFPFINTSWVDLSCFAIFSTFKVENYEENCLVKAIMNSSVVDPSYRDFIKSIMNVRCFPTQSLHQLAELIKVNFEVIKYSEKQKKNKIKQLFPRQSNPKWPVIHLLIRHGHFLLNEDVPITEFYLKHKAAIDAEPKMNPARRTMTKNYSLEKHSWQFAKKPANVQKVITWLLELNLLKPLTDEQYTIAIRAYRAGGKIESTHPDFSPECLEKEARPAAKGEPVKYCNDYYSVGEVRKWTNLSEVEATDTQMLEAFKEFSDVIQDEYDLNPIHYRSLAQLGEAILFKAGAFDDVYELIGGVSDFIRKCCDTAKPLMGVAYSRPQRTDEGVDIIQIDRNSSYPAVYRDMEGIPSGPPRKLNGLEELNGAAYYFILIRVRAFKCKHKADPFPLLTRCGLHYVDKVYFALMLQHYEVQYDFVEGVAFDSVNNGIANVSRCLYTRMMQLKDRGSVAQLLIKRLLNSLWGKYHHHHQANCGASPLV